MWAMTTMHEKQIAGRERGPSGQIAEAGRAQDAAAQEISGAGAGSGQAFEEAVLQHMDAAYNLASWLTGSELDAEDVVQTAMLRAFQGFDGFRGGNARAWLLTIVRHSSYTWLKKNRATTLTTEFDEELHGA